MPVQDEKDYLKRQIKLLARAVARALSLGRAGRTEDSQQELRAACGDALGLDFELLALLDCGRAIAALGSPERVQAYAGVLEAQADLDDLAGRPEGARALRARAAELLAASSR